MRLIKFAHACVRLESDVGVLVTDPGVFSDAAALDGADAVLVTHEHADHLNADALVAAVSQRTSMRVFHPRRGGAETRRHRGVRHVGSTG